MASNAFSLVQSFYEDELYPLGIYVDDKMVGFILYDYDSELSGWSFSRFMIDIHFQDKGYGSKALEKFLDYFHDKFPEENLYTSVEMDNDVAIKCTKNMDLRKKVHLNIQLLRLIIKNIECLRVHGR